MDEQRLARRFEAQRPRLEAVAYRMLGSAGAAEDAVQETWIRLAANGADDIDNIAGWLTTVVGRICLDQLRARRARPERPLEAADRNGVEAPARDDDPEAAAVLRDSVGLAALVVLETLDPAERLAFVLHDMFAVPFDDIARLLDRSPAAARKLASRARRKVHGSAVPPSAEQTRQRRVVEAFVAAAAAGDFDALVAVLDPDVVARTDSGPSAPTVRGASQLAGGAIAFSAGGGAPMRPVLVEGRIGLLVGAAAAPARLLLFTVVDDKVTALDVVTDPQALRAVDATPL